MTGEAWGRGEPFGAARLTQDRLYRFASARGLESSDRSGHAQFVRLAWSIDAGEPIERPAIVACRYQKELCGP